ncbi:MAG: DUF4129 domain-containing protein, partial [Micromonosporaceae bacterium]|nr:DUF4129 domain-containing protein [Micromonosporaceae bacterium]
PGSSGPHRQRHRTISASVATLLAALPLSTLFERWTWLVNAGLALTALCLVALALRALRLPSWVPTVGMVVALPVILAREFPSGQELLVLIPSGATLQHFTHLTSTAIVDLRQYSTPAPDRAGFLFLAVFGIAAVAIIIDLLVVVLRQPAVAGLPMLAMYSVPVAIETGSVSLIPFLCGAAGFLWLLATDSIDRIRRFGKRFSGDGQGVDVWAVSPLASAGRRLGIIGLALAVALPLAVPGMTTGLFDQFGVTGRGAAGGSATTVNLTAMLSGSLKRDRPFEMVRVQTNDTNPYYLRFAVADQLTVSGFHERTVTRGRSLSGGLPTELSAPAGVTQHAHTATVEVLSLDLHYLPVYQQPTRVEQIGKAWVYEPDSSVIYSAKQTTRKKRYTFDYVRSEYSASALRSGATLQNTEPISPDQTYVPTVDQISTLVDRLTSGKQTQYDEVMAIFEYFSPDNGFTYATQTEQGASGLDILDFLSNKRGFCVQYSAAMAWLVRQAGHPARVAFGFSRGSGQLGGTMTLTNYNLHAWTEVFFRGIGWVPFDATPASGVPGSVSPAWAPNPSLPDDEAAAPSTNTAATTPQQTNASAAADPGHEADRQAPQAATARDQGSDLPRWFVWAGCCLLLVLGFLAVPGWRRRAQRRSRLRFHAPLLAPEPDQPAPGGRPEGGEATRRDAHAAWDELLDTMIDYGIPLRDTETPRMTAARLAAMPLPGTARTGVTTLGRAEEQARYAPRPLPITDLGMALDAVSRGLRSRASRRQRLRVAILPPSVLRRWRLMLGR